jgi:hypothetical protein
MAKKPRQVIPFNLTEDDLQGMQEIREMRTLRVRHTLSIPFDDPTDRHSPCWTLCITPDPYEEAISIGLFWHKKETPTHEITMRLEAFRRALREIGVLNNDE